MDTCACTHYCPRCLATQQFVPVGDVECRCSVCGYRILTTACDMRKET